jgi:nicotinate-nucleotide adenylyltransferase
MNTRRIGLMGGTFDPPHLAHLAIAEAAREHFLLERVIWLPAGDPPHKPDTVSPQEHRYAMTLLATADHPHFEVSRLELELEGPSFTLHTLQHYAHTHVGYDLYFIIGADSLQELMTWRRPEEIVKLARVIAVTRPGSELTLAALPPELAPRINLLPQPGMAISSTDLRKRVAAGKSIRYLTPAPVETYLRKHRLYEDGSAANASNSS